ncbi:MAG: FGGY family carbohydrate kinase [Gemmiger sp.]|nr:FGGY family carbohydrate kinase [Gemmiger sp.]
MKAYLIGVDIGTQGTKAGLFDAEMHCVATAFEASRLIQPAPGTVWQEPDEIYGSVQRTIKTLLQSPAAQAGRVQAVGVDSQMAGILGIGADGEAVTCYDSWLDTRCEPYVKQMREQAGTRITQITGGPVTYTHGPKILWWKNERPEVYRRIAKFVLPHGYVVGKMCALPAAAATFDHTCLQYSGFGDNLAKQWSPELLGAFGVESSKMARIASPIEQAGGISAAFAQATGLAAGTPVAVGAGDTAASIFGAGLFEQNRLLDCAGTASVLCTRVNQFVPDTRFGTITMMRAPEENRWYPLAYINGGGLCIRWFRDQFTGTPPASYATLEAEARAVPPGAEGLCFVPHFGGRVLPSNPALRGSFTGLNWKHTRGHLYRAVLEGIAYEYAYYLWVLRQLYPASHFAEMTAVGGGAASRLFLEIKADVLGVKATATQTGDTALVGSAVIAGCAAGLYPDAQAPIRKTLQSREQAAWDAARHTAYAPLARQYRRVLDTVSELYYVR